MKNHRNLFLCLSTSTLLLAGACEKGPKTEPAAPTPSQVQEVSETAPATPKPEVVIDTKFKKGKIYGAGVQPDGPLTSISSIMADPEAYEGKTVRVEGMVTDVCAKRGCWFEMAGEKPGEKARFKVQDGEMVFPMTTKGHQAFAQGKIVTQKLSLEDTRAREAHYAEESGREFDPESITEGKTVFRIEGTGAVIIP